MRHSEDIPLVTTIGEHCRICYTCVRECPAKAIRIAEGQAEVLAERCIGCGNCVRVCSQNAKRVQDGVERTRELLASDVPTAAIVAPSFPAEFTDVHWMNFVGMMRALGFDYVNEVAFGADLVADRYRKLLAKNENRRYIATSCPAIVAYVERYHPDLVEFLAPICSPMVASARALRRMHSGELNVVFIGPCVAKKGEATSENLDAEVDVSLSFVELRRMLEEANIRPDAVHRTDFDPPHAATGALFPIARGLFQAAGLKEDLASGEIVAADGRSSFVEAIKEFGAGHLNARLLEVLACKGCIMGPGVSTDTPMFSRRAAVGRFVQERMAWFDQDLWQAEMDRLADLDLSRYYTACDQRILVPEDEEEVRKILARMGKETPADELNCGACGYDTCREHAIAIMKGLAESEMCLPRTIEQLHTTVQDLAESNEQLASTQEALMQSEKLASMGQLAAGIAHEVNNPLGVVLMYAHLLMEEHGRDPKVGQDLSMIAEQADRCKKIVGGLLNFARQRKVLRQPTEMPTLVDRTLQALQAPDGVMVRTRHEMTDPRAEIDADQIAQVLTNLVSNAYAAMSDGGTLTVTTTGTENEVRIAVADTGTGIPDDIRGKIFEPFYTTKQIGSGTGLGLAVTYGIVKMHSGQIDLETNADPAAGPTGTTFTVSLPRHAPEEYAAPAAGETAQGGAT